MKTLMSFVLLAFMVLFEVIFSACRNEDQLVPFSSISTNENTGHTFDARFTKWITDYPNMVGVVGGDVGTGTFTGEVLNISTAGYVSSIEALYHFNGKIHSFTAHVFVTENATPGVGTAVETGSITEGWLKGANVTGEYKIWGVCPIPTPGNAEGTQCY
jgi:hypothetical protein